MYFSRTSTLLGLYRHALGISTSYLWLVVSPMAVLIFGKIAKVTAITTDRGSQSQPMVFCELNKMLGCSHTMKTACHPLAKNLVEHFHVIRKSELECWSATGFSIHSLSDLEWSTVLRRLNCLWYAHLAFLWVFCSFPPIDHSNIWTTELSDESSKPQTDACFIHKCF